VTTAASMLAALADGLHRRVAERTRAEARLADFVFRDGAGDAMPLAPVEPDGWRYFVARTLAAAGEPGTLDLLERLSAGQQTLASLSGERQVGLDGGLATIDRISGLAAVGLVARDLETGRIGLTALGSAVLAFVLEWERLAARHGAADGPVTG
jgi:hypothetical protein